MNTRRWKEGERGIGFTCGNNPCKLMNIDKILMKEFFLLSTIKDFDQRIIE